MGTSSRNLLIVLSFLIAAYFVAFRFSYEHVGPRLIRVDHLTGQSCDAANDPLLAQNPCYEASDAEKERYAISLATSDAETRFGYQQAKSMSLTSHWTVQDAFLAASEAAGDKSPLPAIDDLEDDSYLVCLCDAENKGYRWEVHIVSRQAIFLDKPEQFKLYGLK